MQDAELSALTSQVLWAAFACAALFGAVAQRTQFCTMGALADVFALGDWSRLRMWLLAIALAVLGFNAMVGLGWVQARQTLYAGPQFTVLSYALGGLLFGFGMVLASGCGAKTLVRIGGGSLKALVVFVVLAFAAAATLRGVTAVARVASVDRVAFTLPAGQDLPSLLAQAAGTPPALTAALLGGAVALALLAFVLAHPQGRSAEVLLGGLGTGLAVAALWWVSGRLGHLAEHPQTLEEAFVATASGRLESLAFVAPVAHAVDWITLFSDRSRHLTIGIVAVFGVVAGSAAVALATRRFRWEGFAGTEDTANHVVGALLMGVGGVTAMGCTVGQGISGVSTLSLGSLVALSGIVGGAWLALRYQSWRIERGA